MPKPVGVHQGVQTLRFMHRVYFLLAVATGFAVWRWSATEDSAWLGFAVTTGMLAFGALVDLILVSRSLP